MPGAQVTLGLAALAGVVSFLSPCVLALVPAYLGYLSGRALTPSGELTGDRWETFIHGLAFVAGFSAVFIGMGLAASAVGMLLFEMRTGLTRLGGAIVVVFGLHTMGVIRIPFLDFDTRRQAAPDRRWGLLSSVLMGVFFSAGWSPCVGPVLGAVLTLALDSAQLGRGALLLAAYSAGLAIPFLLAALGIGGLGQLLRHQRTLVRFLSLATGALLLVVGVLLLTGTLSRLAGLGFLVDLGL